MSKNVAVFVDVANIFYAAKAAGVDIDYVTLLKAATAGRDFVRAYAYTGLDPDNENQRNFHQFLSRHGYKVVSKDIRKYGDGKVKANLDIELVVDMLKTARNLDIAVLVSGDGDFAPAVRAVQEMGVRVEVISFRGNTSSDLIEAADQFIDITQIAKVDKTSTRSGRRVAAGDEDLSMTEVPAKQTEGETERARRRRAQARAAAQAKMAEAPAGQEAVATVDATLPAPITILPGEKLSKFAGIPADGEAEAPSSSSTPAVGQPAEAEPMVAGTAEEGGRRRRRRRRRSRGRGSQELLEAAVSETPTSPRPTHAFGSVWDSQIGMPTAPTAELEALTEEDLEEPEVPEYLLAERKRRSRPVSRGGHGGYAAAVERERFGRTARPAAGERRHEARAGRRPTEPWSEVPPEIEALLRAQLASRGEVASPADHTPPHEGGAQEAAPATGPEAPETRPAARAGRSGRGRRRAVEGTAEPISSPAETAATPSESSPAEPTTVALSEAPAAPKRSTRRRRTTDEAPASATGEGSTMGEASDTTGGAGGAPARRRGGRRRTTSEPAPEPGAEGG